MNVTVIVAKTSTASWIDFLENAKISAVVAMGMYSPASILNFWKLEFCFIKPKAINRKATKKYIFRILKRKFSTNSLESEFAIWTKF
jgi:hypothetical protein